MEILLAMDKESVAEFTQWYINHPYSKGMRNYKELSEEEDQIERLASQGRILSSYQKI